MEKYWNKENVIEESKKYTSKSEFGKKKSGAYHFALKNDLLKEMIWLKRPKRYDIIKWNYETVIYESKKYTSRSEFAKKCDGAYKYALKNDLLDNMTWLKSKELFGENGQKIDNVYAYEFNKFKVVYVGRTIDTERRDRQHRKHLSDNNKGIKKSPVYNFAEKNGIEIPKMKILDTNITILEGQKLEKQWLDRYLDKGWKILNKGKCGEGCGSLGALNTINRKWNSKNVIEESKKYESKVQFKKNSNGAYGYARRHNLLKEMIWLKKPDIWNKKWKDDNSVIEESKKYGSKSEFKKKSCSAYDYARQHNLLKEMTWLKRPKKYGYNR